MQKMLRVGLDLDGVILYNPARVARPIIKGIKHIFLPKREHVFYVPQRYWEQQAWRLLHLTSLFVAPGFDEIIDMAVKKHIKLFIITARFDYLREDFELWMKRIQADKYDIEYYHNIRNEQPHLYKAQKVRELDLDFFIEDNWDIVSHLNKALPDTNVIWMKNIMDQYIAYPLSVSSLHKAGEIIRAHL